MNPEYFKEAWIYKSHYYDFYNNFYNFPYTFGHLFSLGLYKFYLNNKEEFIPKYNMILKNSGKNNLKDLCNMCGIDITKKEFFKNSIEILKDKFEKYKSLVCENQEDKFMDIKYFEDRKDIEEKYTWNLEKIYKNIEEFEKDFEYVKEFSNSSIFL